jgi:hypothetical protein
LSQNRWKDCGDRIKIKKLLIKKATSVETGKRFGEALKENNEFSCSVREIGGSDGTENSPTVSVDR